MLALESLHQRMKRARGNGQVTEQADVPAPEAASSLKQRLDERVTDQKLGYSFAVDPSAKADPDAAESQSPTVIDDGLFLSFDDGDEGDWDEFDGEPDDDGFDGMSVEPMPFGGQYDGPAAPKGDEPDALSDLPRERPPAEPERERVLVFEEGLPSSELRIVRPLDGAPKKLVQIRDFPKELMDLVREQFKFQGTMRDMLAAFVYIKLGQSCPLPSSVLDQIKSFRGDAVLESTAKTIAQMNERLQRQEALLRELELAISWLMFDKMGFAPPVPRDPRTAEINLDGVSALIDRLKFEAKQKQNQDAIRAGRAGRVGGQAPD